MCVSDSVLGVVSMTVAQRHVYPSVWSPTAVCSFSLDHSVLECLQKAHVLEPFPSLNPTSDCFVLREYWNPPTPKGSTTNLLKPGWGWRTHLCFVAPCHSLLGHLCSFFVSYSPPYHLWTRATVPSSSSLSAQTSCSFRNLGLWATLFLSDVFLSTYPACRRGAHPKHLQGSSHDFSLVLGMEKCSLGLIKALSWLSISPSHLPRVPLVRPSFFSFLVVLLYII